MKADKQTETEVIKTLESMLAAYGEKDLENVMMHYAKDPDVTAVGTNLDQLMIGIQRIQEAYQEDFDGFSKLGISMNAYHISAEGHVAWVCASCAASFEVEGDEVRSNARLTAVLVKRDNHWLIVQFHVSFPADQQGTEVTPYRL